MTRFFDELEGDEIYFRDRWQFEQKYDFLPDPDLKTNDYTQEFYLFIPNALQVSGSTYSMEQFYKDQTNLIRFKTPVFTLKEIADLHYSSSPLTKLHELKDQEQNTQTQSMIEQEIQLLGNVVRSAIRTKAQHECSLFESKQHEEFKIGCRELIEDIQNFLETFESVKKDLAARWDVAEIKDRFDYATLFLNHVIDEYLMLLLERIRLVDGEEFRKIDQKISEIVLSIQEDIPFYKDDQIGETIVYKKGLLNKFFVNALLLNINRFSPRQRYQNVIGAFAAGIAMLVFFTLFAWQGEFFIINSTPFILITVLLYILKDRIKEGIKSFTHHRRLGWFSDYTTKIKSPDDKYILGVLTEKFSYIDEDELPPEINTIRNREFHNVIESFKRPETVIFYKRRMKIYEKPVEMEARRFMLNIIFRFNIRHFMDKASNPYTPYLWLDEDEDEIKIKQLPKVYHLNIIVKTTIKRPGKSSKKEISKIRIIADKNGIKRIEYP